jgi:hypothetical protein
MLSCRRERDREREREKRPRGGDIVTIFQGKDKKFLALRVPAKCPFVLEKG